MLYPLGIVEGSCVDPLVVEGLLPGFLMSTLEQAGL